LDARQRTRDRLLLLLKKTAGPWAAPVEKNIGIVIRCFGGISIDGYKSEAGYRSVRRSSETVS
jgi:hypothetical protein